ncbi:MAG: phosphoglycerate mutase (2,3-diphosphoglycerate-independent) [Deltaproteobacteria bacterium GWC2_42_11]|nr:MAG: phosphoglycerate mutase (2,3-diphosphoglycerate-independent) [Deltaproteobacteria bacterium GWC2_42_11]HBO84879.1 2,3-bisphosphoglycerate-independent phosphoglycerate mutase [Deltaproteobacteria bacterium]
MKVKPLILIVLDGWGMSPRTEGNAQYRAGMLNLTRFYKEYPWTELECSGLAVGLPEGQMGNSEVGHLTIGAGRIIYQELTRINSEIKSGGFFRNIAIRESMRIIRENGKNLHLFGLVSDGGVHSHIEHLFALLDMAHKEGLEDVFIHVFLDGRDTPPTSGKSYIEQLKKYISTKGVGKIATVSGRYYAMDRDNRWQRVEKAYKAIRFGVGRKSADPAAAASDAYNMGETDEFIIPTVIMDNEKPVGTVNDGDGIIFFNFRADRAREITRVFTQDNFTFFDRGVKPVLSIFLCFTEYDADFNLPVAFSPQNLKNILAEVISNSGLKQLHIAETEKYAHVTFFFNGGVEKAFEGEDRILIPSPKDVPTYDKKPEMSAFPITEEVIKHIDGGYSFLLVNFANGDMVGHTGVFEAAVNACMAVDECLGQIVNAAAERNWTVIITSDHGNVEQMLDYETNLPYTAHTTNAVPFILIDNSMDDISLNKGGLSDIAPTILELMNIKKPDEMTGNYLIKLNSFDKSL